MSASEETVRDIHDRLARMEERQIDISNKVATIVSKTHSPADCKRLTAAEEKLAEVSKTANKALTAARIGGQTMSRRRAALVFGGIPTAILAALETAKFLAAEMMKVKLP